ncbi:polymer-forming cytoskeletal protein [Rhodoferax sp. GW822-FHT02A01]|uniref:bactofilin family protein n=1 Tax=Rhodoferax sp. GW822-FHT02A01 TaxID=3141537 RepID=UPI00315D3434
MALQPAFFGKRPNDPLASRPLPGQPGAVAGSHPVAAGAAPVAPAPTPAPVQAPAAPIESAATPAISGAPIKEGGSKLTVGPNIKLKGVEITDCDTLIVEGTVEATMDSRVMHITSIGAFKGSAEIDYAEIHGAFNGDLTVREKLVVYSTGRVSGKIRYGKLVIEEGGQLTGDIQFGTANPSKESASAKVGLLAAA